MSCAKTTFTKAAVHRNLILHFHIPHNTLCLPPPPLPRQPQILYKSLFTNTLVNMQCPKSIWKQWFMVYAESGGQTKCIMGNVEIENADKQTREAY